MSSMTVSNNGLYSSYSHIASGKRINTAADDAAGLAIGKNRSSGRRGQCERRHWRIERGGRRYGRHDGLSAENPRACA